MFTKRSTFIQDGKDYTYQDLQQSQPDIPVAQPYEINSSGKIVKMGSYKGYGLYQSYTKAQLKTLKDVLIQIQKEYPNITIGSNKTTFKEQFPTKDSGVSTSAFNNNAGIFTHNSYRTDKTDVFPQKELIELLQEF